MVESSGDPTRKKGLEINSGDVSPVLARTACAEPLRPFKRNPSEVPQAPFSPQTGLSSSPSRDESHRLSSLPSPCVPFISRLRRLLDKPSASLELARENPWEKAGEELPRGYPIGPGCPLGLMICLIRMLCHPKSPAAHPDQAYNQPDIDTSRQTLGLAEALVQAPNCGS
jgi:hypothetical protein